MGSESTTFDAVIIAGIGGMFGVTYLFGAMLALLSNSGEGMLLLAGSVTVTATVGLLLTLTAGLLGTGHGYGRYVGILSFGAVVLFGRPSLSSPEAFPVAQAGIALLVTVFLVFRNPVPTTDRSNIDESTSASRVGSTIR